jgi:hypothetical protein
MTPNEFPIKTPKRKNTVTEYCKHFSTGNKNNSLLFNNLSTNEFY